MQGNLLNTGRDEAGPAPRISVLMPVYNAEAYLATAIASILAQTYADFELICVDDGSRDGSLAALRQFEERDPRVRAITRPNTGIVGALNDGLAAARGELVARMDADDWCDASRFAEQVTYLDANRGCVAVGTWVRRADPYGSPAGSQEPPIDHASIDARLLRGDAGAMVHATLMMRREALAAIGGWNPSYDWVEDLDLFLRLAEAGRVANLARHLYTYRRHAESVCSTKNDLMYPKLTAVLHEAYARRGISGEPDLRVLRPDLNEPRPSAAKVYRDWACHAIHAGNAEVARKHAWQALRREPMSLESWKVAYWSLAA